VGFLVVRLNQLQPQVVEYLEVHLNQLHPPQVESLEVHLNQLQLQVVGYLVDRNQALPVRSLVARNQLLHQVEYSEVEVNPHLSQRQSSSQQDPRYLEDNQPQPPNLRLVGVSLASNPRHPQEDRLDRQVRGVEGCLEVVVEVGVSWEDWEVQLRLITPTRIRSELQLAPAPALYLEVQAHQETASLVAPAALHSVQHLPIGPPSHSLQDLSQAAVDSPLVEMWPPLALESSKARHQNHLPLEEHQPSELNHSAPRQPSATLCYLPPVRPTQGEPLDSSEELRLTLLPLVLLQALLHSGAWPLALPQASGQEDSEEPPVLLLLPLSSAPGDKVPWYLDID